MFSIYISVVCCLCVMFASSIWMKCRNPVWINPYSSSLALFQHLVALNNRTIDSHGFLFWVHILNLAYMEIYTVNVHTRPLKVSSQTDITDIIFWTFVIALSYSNISHNCLQISIYSCELQANTSDEIHHWGDQQQHNPASRGEPGLSDLWLLLRHRQPSLCSEFPRLRDLSVCRD